MLKAYIMHIDRDLTEAEYQGLLPCVSEGRRDRLSRLRDFSDRQRALLGEALARCAISEQLGLGPKDIVIAANRHGKPELPDCPHLHFNISHSGKYVVCAIGGAPVGIDVEMRRQRGFAEIAQRFFHAEENEHLKSFRAGDERAAAFADIWTMKESYIKRDGRGLAIPLASFSVLSLPNITFHKILDTPEAVCHLCS